MQIKYRIHMAHAIPCLAGNNAWTASCDTIELIKMRFNYSLRHLPVTILIDWQTRRCNYISPTGQFGEYRH